LGHSSSATAKTMFLVSAPRKPVSTMTKGRKGRLSAMSAMRIRMASMVPPK
jgi:hypothetical protein